MSWKWYGVKTVFRTESKGKPKATDSFYDPEATLIEERIVLIRARNFDEAIRKAEKEATEYCKESIINTYGERVTTRYLGACNAFELFDEPDVGVEVYSATEMVNQLIDDQSVINRILGLRNDEEDCSKRKRFLNREFNKPIGDDA